VSSALIFLVLHRTAANGVQVTHLFGWQPGLVQSSGKQSYDCHTNGAFMKLIIVSILSIYLLLTAFVPLKNQSEITTTENTLYLPIVIKAPVAPINAVVNGDFEAGRTGWIEYEDSPYFSYPLIVHESEVPLPIEAYNGVWLAWLGGDSDLITYIEQEVTIPEVSPELVYWLWIDSMFDCDDSVGGVIIDETYVDLYNLCADTDTKGWVKRTVDLNDYAGQTVRLRIFSWTDVDNFSSLYIDAVSIHASP
jgi:hypothetical protein